MTRKVRRLLLISLIIIFFVISPAVFFYALGYSFDWQKKKLVLTGGIYLQSIPKKAEIYLNGRFKNQTPRLLKRLVPKEYQIRVAKDGYHSWQKKLKVGSKLVTEARNIFLVPQNPVLELVKINLDENFSIEDFLKDDTREQLSDTFRELFSGEVAGYKITKQNIFYLQKPSYILYQTDLAGLNQNQISLLPLPEADYRIIVSPNQKLAALGDDNRLYLFNPEKRVFEQLAENIKGAQFSNDNKKLLYFSQSEIWVAYLEDILIQPYKKTGEKELITRLSQEIKQAIWYPETNEHIIFSVGQFIKITELDNRDTRNTVDFLEKETNQISYDQKAEKLYFTQKDKLYRVSLE